MPPQQELLDKQPEMVSQRPGDSLLIALRVKGMNGSAQMRILLRKQQEQLYVQPSGQWGESRETAREFAGAGSALGWAHEQKLRGVEILLAFEDARDWMLLR